MRLFPRLDDSPALQQLARSLATGGIDHCRQQRSGWHLGAWYGPSGGDQIGPQELQGLADVFTRIVEQHGYPDTGHRDTRNADIDLSIALFERMGISPVEATTGGIWNFLSCILVPDLVAWRFPVRDQSAEPGRLDRWIVGRRWYRHALGRLWWRACMFRDPEADDPWHLMRQLHEDEFIQLLERPHLVGYRDAILHLVRAMLDVFHARADLNRGDLMRIAAKRLLRLGAVVDLHALDHAGLTALMQEISLGSVTSLEAAHAGSAGA